MAIIANTIFNLLVKIKICKQPPKRYNINSASTGSGNTSQSHITITIPLVKNVDNSDAERRRLKALKALKERLKKPGEEDDIKSQWSDTTALLEQPVLEINETKGEENSLVNNPGQAVSTETTSINNASSTANSTNN